MTDFKKINLLHRAIRISFNRNSSPPSFEYLLNKLKLNSNELAQLIKDAKESGLEVLQDTFEFSQYSKLDYNTIKFGTENYSEFNLNNFIEYKKRIEKKLINLDFDNDELTEDILELAGTINKYLQILINRFNNKDSNENNLNKSSYDYQKVMSPIGEKPKLLTSNQLEDSLYEFLEPFQNIFFKIGLIYEGFDGQVQESQSEQDLYDDYMKLNFDNILGFIKLYEDGEFE